ncbi:tyrosine-type recombinase/integrase [Roseomonas chloroacetimidivorans]|uniref:tyrosine-type recombinase/integrase n=1 Tax=Roseomonas chloroacetimidivorans TaxID=1766656 RepID=UPI003C732081
MTHLPPATSGILRERFVADMAVRGFTEKTRKDYLRTVAGFAAFLERSPGTATAEDIRRFQIQQSEQGMNAPAMNSTVAALRFFFNNTVDRPDLARKLIRLRYPRKLPVVLSPDEVARLIAATTCLKHRAALSVAYGAGLRVAEVASLIPECRIEAVVAQVHQCSVPGDGQDVERGLRHHAERAFGAADDAVQVEAALAVPDMGQIIAGEAAIELGDPRLDLDGVLPLDGVHRPVDGADQISPPSNSAECLILQWRRLPDRPVCHDRGKRQHVVAGLAIEAGPLAGGVGRDHAPDGRAI